MLGFHSGLKMSVVIWPGQKTVNDRGVLGGVLGKRGRLILLLAELK